MDQSPIRPEIVYQLDRLVGYYHPLERKEKNKRKRISPQRVKIEQVEEKEPPQQQEESVQGSKDTPTTQVQDDPQLPPFVPN